MAVAVGQNSDLDLTYQKDCEHFISKLRRFHDQRGSHLGRLPTFCGRPLDLFALYNTVTSFGGISVVTEQKKWEQVFKALNLPSCTNAAFALRQHYARCLETYERINFFGEDAEGDNLRPAGAAVHGYHKSVEPPGISTLGEQRVFNFDRISLSLQSGLPNEVDFALNICTLLSNVTNSIFNLAKSPGVLDLMLAHVGIWSPDNPTMKDLHKEWYSGLNIDANRFWLRSVDDECALEYYRSRLRGTAAEIQEVDHDSFSNEDLLVDSSCEFHKNSTLVCRVNQVSMILYNFSFEQVNAMYLASHHPAKTFLLLSSGSCHHQIRHTALEALDNIAEHISLPGCVDDFALTLLNILKAFVSSSDRFRRVRAMSIMSKLTMSEENEDMLTKGLTADIYEAVLAMLVLPDISLILSALDLLYFLSDLNEDTATMIAMVHAGVETLVCLTTVRAESYGNRAIAGYRIVENKQSIFTMKNQALLRAQQEKGFSQVATGHVFPARSVATGVSARPLLKDGSLQKVHPMPLRPIPSRPVCSSNSGKPITSLGQFHPVGFLPPRAPATPGSMPDKPASSEQVPNVCGEPLVEMDSEMFAAHWMSAYYEPNSHDGLVSMPTVYSDYLLTCQMIKREGVLPLQLFHDVLRTVLPPHLAQIVTSQTDGTPAIRGVQRRATPLPVHNRLYKSIAEQIIRNKPPGGLANYSTSLNGPGKTATPLKKTSAIVDSPKGKSAKKTTPKKKVDKVTAKMVAGNPVPLGFVCRNGPQAWNEDSCDSSMTTVSSLDSQDDQKGKLCDPDVSASRSLLLANASPAVAQVVGSPCRDVAPVSMPFLTPSHVAPTCNPDSPTALISPAVDTQHLPPLDVNKLASGALPQSARECYLVIEQLKREMHTHFSQFHIHRHHIQGIQTHVQQLMTQSQIEQVPAHTVRDIQQRVEAHHREMQLHYQNLQQLTVLLETVQKHVFAQHVKDGALAQADHSLTSPVRSLSTHSSCASPQHDNSSLAVAATTASSVPTHSMRSSLAQPFASQSSAFKPPQPHSPLPCSQPQLSLPHFQYPHAQQGFAQFSSKLDGTVGINSAVGFPVPLVAPFQSSVPGMQQGLAATGGAGFSSPGPHAFSFPPMADGRSNNSKGSSGKKNAKTKAVLSNTGTPAGKKKGKSKAAAKEEATANVGNPQHGLTSWAHAGPIGPVNPVVFAYMQGGSSIPSDLTGPLVVPSTHFNSFLPGMHAPLPVPTSIVPPYPQSKIFMPTSGSFVAMLEEDVAAAGTAVAPLSFVRPATSSGAPGSAVTVAEATVSRQDQCVFGLPSVREQHTSEPDTRSTSCSRTVSFDESSHERTLPSKCTAGEPFRAADVATTTSAAESPVIDRVVGLLDDLTESVARSAALQHSAAFHSRDNDLVTRRGSEEGASEPPSLRPLSAPPMEPASDLVASRGSSSASSCSVASQNCRTNFPSECGFIDRATSSAGKVSSSGISVALAPTDARSLERSTVHNSGLTSSSLIAGPSLGSNVSSSSSLSSNSGSSLSAVRSKDTYSIGCPVSASKAASIPVASDCRSDALHIASECSSNCSSSEILSSSSSLADSLLSVSHARLVSSATQRLCPAEASSNCVGNSETLGNEIAVLDACVEDLVKGGAEPASKRKGVCHEEHVQASASLLNGCHGSDSEASCEALSRPKKLKVTEEIVPLCNGVHVTSASAVVDASVEVDGASSLCSNGCSLADSPKQLPRRLNGLKLDFGKASSDLVTTLHSSPLTAAPSLNAASLRGGAFSLPAGFPGACGMVASNEPSSPSLSFFSADAVERPVGREYCTTPTRPPPLMSSKSQLSSARPSGNAHSSKVSTPSLPQFSTRQHLVCQWRNCEKSCENNSDLLEHMISTHAPVEGRWATCKIAGCSQSGRTRSAMLLHFQQKHCLEKKEDGTYSPLPLPDIRLNPKQPPPEPVEVPSVYHTEGPLRQEPLRDLTAEYEIARERAEHLKLFPHDDESPVTRSVRFTAALILRNIARRSPYGRRLIRSHEVLLASVAMSMSEASTTAAQCLMELSDRQGPPADGSQRSDDETSDEQQQQQPQHQDEIAVPQRVDDEQSLSCCSSAVEEYMETCVR